MGLLRSYLSREIAELHKQGVRFRVIGERERLDDDIVALIEQAERTTEGNTILNLTIALSYGGRAEVANAARALAKDVAAGRLCPESIDEATLAGRLETTGIPDPDLLIRTSGEKRISNFMLWQCAYTEFVFVDNTPDFSRPIWRRRSTVRSA